LDLRGIRWQSVDYVSLVLKRDTLQAVVNRTVDFRCLKNEWKILEWLRSYKDLQELWLTGSYCGVDFQNNMA